MNRLWTKFCLTLIKWTLISLEKYEHKKYKGRTTNYKDAPVKIYETT